MATIATTRQGYSRRPVPAQYAAGFFATELQNIQRATLYLASGTFTCSAAASTTVNDTRVGQGSVILLSPTNAAAATLMAGTKLLYVSALVATASFTVTTQDGTAAAGTETFGYVIVG